MGFIHAGVLMLLAMSAMSVNQQYILNDFKQKYIEQGYYWFIDKKVTIRGSQEPNSVLPLGAMVQYLLIQCSQQLYKFNKEE